MPKAKKEPPKRDVGVRMPADLHSRLCAYCRTKGGMPLALVVRMAVREYLDVRETDR